jgi:hypothetical protein
MDPRMGWPNVHNGPWSRRTSQRYDFGNLDQVSKDNLLKKKVSKDNQTKEEKGIGEQNTGRSSPLVSLADSKRPYPFNIWDFDYHSSRQATPLG